MRGQWVDTMRKRWNERNPKNEVATFQVDVFSPEREEYMKIWWIAIISIRVDNDFYFDVRKDGDIDGKNFGKNYWHATTVRLLKNWLYQFIDSSFGKDGIYTIEKDRLKEFVLFGNMKDEAHIILPLEIITMITKDVPSNQRYSEAVQWMIENVITTETEKFRPQDNVTRAEMAVFMKRLYDKIK